MLPEPRETKDKRRREKKGEGLETQTAVRLGEIMIVVLKGVTSPVGAILYGMSPTSQNSVLIERFKRWALIRTRRRAENHVRSLGY